MGETGRNPELWGDSATLAASETSGELVAVQLPFPLKVAILVAQTDPAAGGGTLFIETGCGRATMTREIAFGAGLGEYLEEVPAEVVRVWYENAAGGGARVVASAAPVSPEALAVTGWGAYGYAFARPA